MNHEAHFAHLLDLLKIERVEDRKQYEQKIRNRSAIDRRKEGVTWYPVTISKSYLSTGERWVFHLERTQELGKRHMFQAGSSVSLFVMDDKVIHSINAVASFVAQDSMKIVLNSDDPPDWIDEGKLGVDLLFDESTYEEMEKAMRALQKVKDGRILELINVFTGKQSPRFTTTKKNESRFGLNKSQSEAVDNILISKDVALVHGPPGTGKTTTLVQAIVAVLDQEKQVLVCTASNAALDLLVEKLSRNGIKVLRLGHPGRVDEVVVASTLDVQLSQHSDAKMLKDMRKKSEAMRRMGLQYKRKFGREEREQRKMLLDDAKKLKYDARNLEDHMIYQLLQETQVVACTLIGANSNYLRKKEFSTVFIDEASQALEPASWIPIMKSQKVVLAGDHLQLPPTVKSMEAAKKGLSETLFERCMNTYTSGKLLETQYRMHQDIASFSNTYFYNGRLLEGDVVAKRRQLFSEAAVFVDTAGCGFNEAVNEETLSTYNREQSVFTIRFLNQIVEGCNEIGQLSVGVIAPYKAQVLELKQVIVSYDWYPNLKSSITINSVDAFQGQERDIVVIDLVRSNDRGEVGFLADERRINVALTRARHKLVVIGDSATLCNHPFFDELIKYFQDKNLYHSAFEYSHFD